MTRHLGVNSEPLPSLVSLVDAAGAQDHRAPAPPSSGCAHHAARVVAVLASPEGASGTLPGRACPPPNPGPGLIDPPLCIPVKRAGPLATRYGDSSSAPTAAGRCRETPPPAAHKSAAAVCRR